MEKHSIRRALCLLLAALILLPAALLICGFLLPAQYGETWLGELPAKQQLLSRTYGKRIIVIGGSSVPFALVSSLLQEQFPDYTVIDYGLYAEMGITAMLDLAKRQLHEGDLVILEPEQSAEILTTDVDGECLLQACDGNFELFLLLSPSELEQCVYAFPAFSGKKLRYALTGAPVPSDIYARSSFNSSGDVDVSGREQCVMADGYLVTQPISFSEDAISPELIAVFNAFAETAEAAGAEVFYHFSPMNAAAVSADEEALLDDYYDLLASSLEFPILGNPHDCILDSGWFYDSNFHLNSSGAVVFTALLADDLRLALRDPSPVTIALPSMPAAVQPESAQDSSDAECFTYRETDNGLVVTGVTEAGRAAAELILPAEVNGTAVTGIDEDALHDCIGLQTLTIQPNISTLWDGLASGCTALRVLRLTASDPSSYAVGDDLMQGAEFHIAVPSDALDTYRRSYFWQQYEPWLEAAEENAP